jgi:hypothetical protein
MGISTVRINKSALGGGLALIGIGAAAVAAGVAICAFVAGAAVRDRIVQWQQDPSTLAPTDLALHHLQRITAATGASVNAWRDGISTQTLTD